MEISSKAVCIRLYFCIYNTSYCTTECNTSHYTFECSILFKNHIVRLSAIYHTVRPSAVFLSKFILYVRVQYILSKVHTVRPSAVYSFIIHIVRPSAMYLSHQYYTIQCSAFFMSYIIRPSVMYFFVSVSCIVSLEIVCILFCRNLSRKQR